ncbi:M23 family metallopeptidase [Streptomyces avicenniae]|uniref:M23 family metallopeptidase n=1 Tax=Streptomyces avicenniae TaxID=500153 RepID=UPI00069BD008|nr:M23 family metallopeptidase [Streptomyces avicenniae]
MSPLPARRPAPFPPRRSPSSARLTRKVVGGTLAGALVIAGPWALAGGDGEDDGRSPAEAAASGAVEDGVPRDVSYASSTRPDAPPPAGLPFGTGGFARPEPQDALASLDASGLLEPFEALEFLESLDPPHHLEALGSHHHAERAAPADPRDRRAQRPYGRRGWDELSAEGWTAPVSGHPISASYGRPGDWAAGYHTGVDFATPVGTTVRSVGPGTVVTAAWSGDYGNLVVVRMEDDHYTLYAHLSEIDVRVGEDVTGGTTVGASGNTGNSTGPHLHFEVRTGEDYGTDVDPLEYLAGHGVTLD